jgi:hypothetical protein
MQQLQPTLAAANDTTVIMAFCISVGYIYWMPFTFPAVALMSTHARAQELHRRKGKGTPQWADDRHLVTSCSTTQYDTIRHSTFWCATHAVVQASMLGSLLLN